jgi:hypothetical protein
MTIGRIRLIEPEEFINEEEAFNKHAIDFSDEPIGSLTGLYSLQISPYSLKIQSPQG